ncbi:fungal-specific transcription factor domain-containing protein [Gloeopeniophorella convolvens]|nr:fungal-specific transcription factor domain-containing protein [Gloeopeniophorella convolvens]
MSRASSDEEGRRSSGSSPSKKRRRVYNTRACDRCRVRKIRCDGNPAAHSKCTPCRTSGSVCVLVEKPRKPAAGTLASRLDRMEDLLLRVRSDEDHSDLDGRARVTQMGGPEATEQQTDQLVHKAASSASSLTHFSSSSPSPGSDREDSDGSLPLDSELVTQLRSLSVNPNQRTYFGKSSGATLLRSAMDAKSVAVGSGHWSHDPTAKCQGRPEFWQLHPWEKRRLEAVKMNYMFPEPELMSDLIEIFFDRISHVMPLLHKPTFMRLFINQEHIRDDKFGTVVLLVCATASRFSQDPRIFLEEADHHPHSAGWKWFEQVTLFSKMVVASPGLYDLQAIALSVLYLYGSTSPQEWWNTVGMGLRLAQDSGAHKRATHRISHTVEDELWTRAFWVLMVFDIWASSYLGRPCSMSAESFDIDLPVECDDEYWENLDPQLAFKQPAGKPSTMSYFIYVIKLNLIHHNALRAIYPQNKAKSANAVHTPEKIVTELDSALNDWHASVPPHISWDLKSSDELFAWQAAVLHITYRYIQIVVHRTFIPSSRKPSSLSFPSLTICTTAARACSHAIDELYTHHPGRTGPFAQLPAVFSGMVLLLCLWSAKRSSVSPELLQEVQDVQKCIRFLDASSNRWATAGRYRDILDHLMSYGQPPSGDRGKPLNRSSWSVGPGQQHETTQLSTESSACPRRDAQASYNSGSPSSAGPSPKGPESRVAYAPADHFPGNHLFFEANDSSRVVLRSTPPLFRSLASPADPTTSAGCSTPPLYPTISCLWAKHHSHLRKLDLEHTQVSV